MIRIIALTPKAKELGLRIQQTQPESEIWYKPKPFAEKIQSAFREGEKLLFICATGIVIRTLAPVLNNKQIDPPVLVMDEMGDFVIPLLSGHEGGANHWAATVAKHMNAQLVLTTANAYLKPIYTLGMGCERGCPQSELQPLLVECLAHAALSIDQIESISSIDIKADEVGLIALAHDLNKPFLSFDVAQLTTVESGLSTRSDYIFNTVGVYGVAESAALYAAQLMTGEAPELVLTKRKTSRATCAIARSYIASSHQTKSMTTN